ncbi:MAG: fructose-1,6-bisphosphatase [Chloroflexi bacterium]|nr:fructose-1,6-bisphosphatase [Chloroflexota bacterium]
MNETELLNSKYLKLLSGKYPTIEDTSTEIINLTSLLQLPKGTEHFMSDLHAEHEAFIHILNNASGEIRQKIDQLYDKLLTANGRAQLATLIYYPEEKLRKIRAEYTSGLDDWYRITLHRLIELSHFVSLKYSRNKVRRSIPAEYGFIINELINAENMEREYYIESIIDTIVEIGSADEMITALATVIKRLIVDRLHIVGDLFDRGERPDIIIDLLQQHHAVDIQWGNHDVLWMGAACGSKVCIANVLFNAIKYGNLDSLETAYGINLRPLAVFAKDKIVRSDKFKLSKISEVEPTDDIDLMIRMYQAICILLFKLAGQVIHRHPEYHMSDRLLLERIDYQTGKVDIQGTTYDVALQDLKQIDPDKPYELTEAEDLVMQQLVTSFLTSDKLQSHIRFLYSVGSIYLKSNNNLMFHGCIPLNEDGTFQEFEFGGETVSGKRLMDYADKLARQGYYAEDGSKEKEEGMDFLWYLWCGRNSPLFGRMQITTFERLFIEDPNSWIEEDNPYYRLIENPEVIKSIFDDFDLDWESGHIINGHIPVKTKKGESPIKANGKVIVIDGGFCRAYQPKTGIAGYTLIYDSHGMRLISHAPFPGFEKVIRANSDIRSREMVFESTLKRLTVNDTDGGARLRSQISDLKVLLESYRKGTLKEKVQREQRSHREFSLN